MLDHLTELVEASRGGALCLFSSRRGAQLAAEHVRAGDLDIDVAGHQVKRGESHGRHWRVKTASAELTGIEIV